jgi:photosystem II stability/assembly factor-like uncharacterized protein
LVNAQWEVVYTFPNPNSAISFITVDNDLFAGTSGDGVLKSQDNGASWEPVNNGIHMGGAYVYSLASRNDSLYAGGFGEVSFSNNGGANWSLLDLNLWLNNRVYALAVKDHYLFAGVGGDESNGVYRKELNGTEWILMDNGLPENVDVYALAVLNNTLIAGTVSGVYLSDDNGENWFSANAGIDEDLSIQSLFVVNGNLLAGTTDGIFVSSDLGTSWNSASGLTDDATVLCFAGIDNMVAAGTYDGVFQSNDNGVTWSDFDALPNTASFLSITSLGDHFYAGSGSVILKRPAGVQTSVIDLNTESNPWSVYPNPFSSEARLELKKPFKNATLTVYNLLGQNVKQIDNLSGHSVIVHRGNLPGGQYFFRMIQDGQIVASDKFLITDQ